MKSHHTSSELLATSRNLSLRMIACLLVGIVQVHHAKAVRVLSHSRLTWNALRQSELNLHRVPIDLPPVTVRTDILRIPALNESKLVPPELPSMEEMLAHQGLDFNRDFIAAWPASSTDTMGPAQEGGDDDALASALDHLGLDFFAPITTKDVVNRAPNEQASALMSSTAPVSSINTVPWPAPTEPFVSNPISITFPSFYPSSGNEVAWMADDFGPRPNTPGGEALNASFDYNPDDFYGDDGDAGYDSDENLAWAAQDERVQVGQPALPVPQPRQPQQTQWSPARAGLQQGLMAEADEDGPVLLLQEPVTPPAEAISQAANTSSVFEMSPGSARADSLDASFESHVSTASLATRLQPLAATPRTPRKTRATPSYDASTQLSSSQLRHSMANTHRLTREFVNEGKSSARRDLEKIFHSSAFGPETSILSLIWNTGMDAEMVAQKAMRWAPSNAASPPPDNDLGHAWSDEDDDDFVDDYGGSADVPQTPPPLAPPPIHSAFKSPSPQREVARSPLAHMLPWNSDFMLDPDWMRLVEERLEVSDGSLSPDSKASSSSRRSTNVSALSALSYHDDDSIDHDPHDEVEAAQPSDLPQDMLLFPELAADAGYGYEGTDADLELLGSFPEIQFPQTPEPARLAPDTIQFMRYFLAVYQQRDSMPLQFENLLPKAAARVVAARSFAHVLALVSKQVLTARQDDAYGSIELDLGSKLVS
ncbi:hypothetical protein CAOG_00985 [Capsaspora owczarzaki ATCC 30864]|uniref:hypothetical protein n=1 Tax=Capsaspora owczarzaki (strain ATCC 30864) TaxID=595528 RepID=UPI0001FE2983|nr:hypothetical protein CAOG_00985 [Capsaspora owczarzaki ATCC 30864]|eukprot:XP_004365856.1 hypothetical protein CAOG_00985 [Capsaspora owczarzaki ATCC 30864]